MSIPKVLVLVIVVGSLAYYGSEKISQIQQERLYSSLSAKTAVSDACAAVILSEWYPVVESLTISEVGEDSCMASFILPDGGNFEGKVELPDDWKK